jgi:UDP-N-acetylmuramoyl-tripeptide--D-alanyl-D-alanine ligase
MRPVAGRLQWRGTTIGASLIDDSYNANPSSMQAAIDVLANQPARRWLVIGDMGELGDFALEAHREAGRYARAHGVERLFAFGSLAALAAESFGAGSTRHTDIQDLIASVRAELTADICLLVKGSRSNRLERLVQALSGAAATGTH